MRANARLIMETLPREARGAEVGTHTGKWTAGLVEIAAPAALTLIDPWECDPARDTRAYGDERTPQEERDAQAATARAAHPDAVIARAPSTETLGRMGDASLDWLFLDGQKHPDVIRADLMQAIRVVRPGGVIAGGGWHWGRVLGRPVRDAVTRLADRLPGARLLQEGQFWSLTLPGTVSLAPETPRRRFLIAATFKNEAPYVLEWIAHHRAVGFTDFLVYTNDCGDTTQALLDRLDALGIVTHHENDVLRRGPQKSAIKWTRDHVLMADCEWCLLADADEFVNVRRADGTIQGLVDALPEDTDAISFPWQVFGNDGAERIGDGLQLSRFTDCEAEQRHGGRRLRDVKTMFRRPEAFHHLGIHRPRVRPEWQDRIVWRTPAGKDISDKMNGSTRWVMKWDGNQDAAYMHHYALRSRQAYLIKKDRGNACHLDRDIGTDYFDKWNLTGGTDRTLQQGVPGFAQELRTLTGDEELARLHADGVRWHDRRLKELLALPQYRALWDALDGRAARMPGDPIPEEAALG
jgi:SAM-dependent methyltransferase